MTNSQSPDRAALAPCPFCGEEQISLNEPSQHYRYGSINCPACLVVMPGEVRDESELIRCWNTRSPPPYSKAAGDAVAWRCFHCHEVFTDEGTAREHFGFSELETPACKLNATEGGIVGLVRRQAEQIEQYHREDTASYREFYSLGSDHVRALQCEEEKGYARGLADARAETPTVLPRDAERAFSQCEKCWQPATCKKYGCRFPLSRDAAAKSETPTVERPIRERLAETSGPEDGGVTAGRDPHPIIEGTLAGETAPISLSRDAEREPFAWVVLSEQTGNTRMWTRNGDIAKAFAAKHLLECIELYRIAPVPSSDAERETIEPSKLEAAEKLANRVLAYLQQPNGLPPSSNMECDCELYFLATDFLDAPSIPPREGVEREAIKPHVYAPDYQAMGDCLVCGHGQNKPWHLSPSPTSVMPDEGKQK